MVMVNVALDAMGMAVILALLIGAMLSSQMDERRGRLFVLMLGLTLLQQLCDLVNWLLEGRPELSQALMAVNFLIFLCAPLTALVFYHYVLSLIMAKRQKLRWLSVALGILCLVWVGMNVLNLSNGMFYGVDERGCYYRGPLYMLSHVYHLSVMVISAGIAVSNRYLSLRHRMALFTYAFLPFVALVFQLMFYGLSSLTYCALTLSMVLIYIMVHLRSIARLEQAGQALTRARKAYQETLYDAETDDLTGLLNRKALLREAERVLGSQRTEGCALWMIDLDRFKGINDRFGHAMGDQVLMAVSQRLRSLFPEGAAVARYGGDEFCAFLPKVSLEELYRLLQHALNTLDFVCEDGDKRVSVKGSIGAAYAQPDESVTYEDLFRQADEALYTAKRNGRHQYAVREMTPAQAADGAMA